ncbi:TIR domain-containing protein [Spirillospora sp. NPDC048911]|uniref:TIR domain-containing protein n=1 Tax=Spirillospora sp. NPDC048911 TaxID=3364527 RepID=UPI003717C861
MAGIREGNGDAFSYDAFLSYGHAHDAKLASVLQTKLERFAKPWYRTRGLRVFRDDADLAADPDLWGAIERALGTARWFVLLASDSAAASPWVNREVTWWLAHRSAARLLIVATERRLVWDDAADDWAPNAPVPPALRKVFRTEPLWVDMSGVTGVDLPVERLADLAAPLHGTPKELLISEQVRQHQRTMRLAYGAVAVMTVLTLLAAGGAFVAVGQRDKARTQARLATSRQLAALATANLSTRLDVAQLLAVEGYRLDHNPQTRAALFQSLASSPRLVRYLTAGARITALAASRDGGVVAVGTASGRVIRWDLRSGHRDELTVGSRGVTQVALNSDGMVVAVADGAAVWVKDMAATAAFTTMGAHLGTVDLAVSPSGKTVAVLDGGPSNSARATLTMHVRASGASVQVRSDSFEHVGLTDDAEVTMFNSLGMWRRMVASNLRSKAAFLTMSTPAGGFAPGSSPDGEYLGYAKYGQVTAWSTRDPNVDTSTPSGFLSSRTPNAPSDDLVISRDGKWAATTRGGALYVGPLSKDSQSAETAPAGELLTGTREVRGLAFLGRDGTRLVSAVGESVALWDLRYPGRLAERTGITVADAAAAGNPPTLVLPPDERLVLMSGSIQGAAVYDFSSRPPRTLVRNDTASNTTPVWDRARKRPLLLRSLDQEEELQTFEAKPVTVGRWTTDGSAPIAASQTPDGGEVVIVDSSGAVRVNNISTGRSRRIAAGPRRRNGLDYVAAGAVDPEAHSAAVASTLGAALIDLGTGRIRQVGDGAAVQVVFTRSNLYVQRATDDLEVWSRDGRTLQRTFPPDGGYHWSFAVSRDERLLARLRTDGSVVLTDPMTSELVGSFQLPYPEGSTATTPYGGTTLAFTTDQRELLTATAGGELIRWAVSADALTVRACATAGRALTHQEWEREVHLGPTSSRSCPPAVRR